jgi:hypothetical protein
LEPRPGCEWWETILLHGSEPEPPEDDSHEGPIEEIHVRSLGGPRGLVGPDGTKYSVYDSEEYSPYIPVHPACLDVAKRALAYRKRTFVFDEKGFATKRVGPATMNQLYDIFSHRSFCGMVGPQGAISEPHHYYGVPDIYERGEWDDQNPDLQVRRKPGRIEFIVMLNKFARYLLLVLFQY